MAFTFRIVFSGLMAFVPDEPFEVTNTPGSISVLLPNALAPRLLNPTAQGEKEVEQEPLILPPHYPFLLFDMDTLRQSRDQEFFFVKESSGSVRVTRQGAVPLLSKDLALRPDGRDSNQGGLRLVNEEVEDPENPSAADLESLFWLKKIGKLRGRARNVNSRLLGAVKEDENLIASRLMLTTGRLRTFEVSGLKWQYVEAGAQISDPAAGERVATKLALEFEADEMVKIVFRDFGGQTSTKLIFAPKVDEPYEDVEIQIQNLEPERLLEITQDDEGEPAPEIDPDFSIYYDLLDGFKTTDARPVPRRVVAPGAGRIAGDGKPCSPAGMNGG